MQNHITIKNPACYDLSTHISADIANIHQSTNQTSPLHMQDT